MANTNVIALNSTDNVLIEVIADLTAMQTTFKLQAKIDQRKLADAQDQLNPDQKEIEHWSFFLSYHLGREDTMRRAIEALELVCVLPPSVVRKYQKKIRASP